MLWRALRDVPRGYYIDIGAFEPTFDSVSLGFYEQGWRGLHVEPVPEYARALREARPDEVVLEVALAESAGVAELFVVENTGMSSLSATWAAQAQAAGFNVATRPVSTGALDDILSNITHDIHWLKIDVEGAERRVLDGWKGNDNLPWIVVIEAIAPDGVTEVHAEWEPLLLQKGYGFSYFDGLNRFYVAPSHRELVAKFRFGPSIWDDFEFPEVSRRTATMRRLAREREAALAAPAETCDKSEKQTGRDQGAEPRSPSPPDAA